MLLKFCVRNFLSFKEGVELSMVANDETSRLMCIKGANGAGKTNLLKAIGFLSAFITRSFTKIETDAPIPEVKPFFDSKEPILFFLEVKRNLEDETVFSYELSLQNGMVKHEALYKTVKRRTLLIERRDNEFTKVNDNNLKIIKLRSNASFISTVRQYDKKLLPDGLWDALFFILSNLELDSSPGFLSSAPVFFKEGSIGPSILSNFSRLYYDNEEIREKLAIFLCNCDVGIEHIEIEFTKDEAGTTRFYPVFFHLANGKKHPLRFPDESAGTQQLYMMYFLLSFVLEVGGCLVFDELDLKLHSFIMQKILGLFSSKETNPKNAQLIFTTHNNEIMDDESLGKQHVFLVNKEENESFGYRADETSAAILRKGRPMLKPYLNGQIGGVPKL